MTEVFPALALGAIVGSFLNVCIHRWPAGQSVVSPRSRCPHCEKRIAWYDNLTVLSFLVLRGRCRACRRGIAWRYPLVEMLNALAYAMVVTWYGTGLEACKLAILASMLLVLIFTDLEHLVLPDQVTLSGIVAGIAMSWFVELRPGLAAEVTQIAGWNLGPQATSLLESVLGTVLFGGGLLLVGEFYYRIRGIEGLGFGDVKLIAMIAAFQGTSEALLVLLAACLVATVAGIAAVAGGGKGWRDPLPLGSYLAGATLVTMFAADAILSRYWGFVLG